MRIEPEDLRVEPLDEVAERLGRDAVLHVVLAVGEGEAALDQELARLLGARDRDHRVARAVRDERGQVLEARLHRDRLGQLLREPRRERDQAREAARIAQHEVVREHAALAEAHHDDLAPIDRVARDRGVEERAHLVAGALDVGGRRRAHRRELEPAEAEEALADLEGERPLGGRASSIRRPGSPGRARAGRGRWRPSRGGRGSWDGARRRAVRARCRGAAFNETGSRLRRLLILKTPCRPSIPAIRAASSTRSGTRTAVRELPNGQTQLLIGLHLIHEVTSPQAFADAARDGPRGALPAAHLRDRRPHHPDRLAGRARSTTRWPRTMMRELEHNCARVTASRSSTRRAGSRASCT